MHGPPTSANVGESTHARSRGPYVGIGSGGGGAVASF
jgi:hypothetical protein